MSTTPSPARNCSALLSSPPYISFSKPHLPSFPHPHFFLSSLMAITPLCSLLLIISSSSLFGNFASATVFSLQNGCPYTIWAATASGNSAPVTTDGSLVLSPNQSVKLHRPLGWSGRFWARTGCAFNADGNGNCTTGDCAGALNCVGSGDPPVTLAEFTLGGYGGNDFYDVSLVDGYNVGMSVSPVGGSNGACQPAGCVSDLNLNCPSELRVTASGSVVACKSACAAFNTPEYCCTGDHATPQTCPATQYSKTFKRACPSAYSYAYDDATSTRTCSGSDYLITFCPSGST